MKKKIIINKNNKSNLDDKISNYYETIFKNIFELNGNINIKESNNFIEVYCDNSFICKFNIEIHEYLYDYILNIYYNDCYFQYCVDNNLERLILNLSEYKFNKENKEFKISEYGFGAFAEISQDKKGLIIDIEGKDIDSDMFEKIVSSLSLDDSIEQIYNRLRILENNYGIQIKKYIKIDNYNTRLTDYLVVKENKVIQYYSNVSVKINGNDYKYILKKDDSGYSIVSSNDSINSLKASIFVLREHMDFLENFDTNDRKILSKIK